MAQLKAVVKVGEDYLITYHISDIFSQQNTT